MTGFEKYLIVHGYKVFHFNYEKMLYEEGYKTVSSIGNTDNRYSKQEIAGQRAHPTDLITIGLNELGYPPHIISRKLYDWQKQEVELSHEQILKILEA